MGAARDPTATLAAPVDLRLVAQSDAPALKVGGDSKPQSVARAIGHVMRESPKQAPPNVTAIGPQAINQAVKAIAIARRQYQSADDAAGDLVACPNFEGALRDGSSVTFVLEKAGVKVSDVVSEDDALSAKPTTDVFKLAGAIAGRVREAKTCSILVKGAVPVLVAQKAIFKAVEYLQADLAGSKLAFAAALVDRENRDLRNAPTSTFTQMTIVVVPAAPAASA